MGLGSRVREYGARPGRFRFSAGDPHRARGLRGASLGLRADLVPAGCLDVQLGAGHRLGGLPGRTASSANSMRR